MDLRSAVGAQRRFRRTPHSCGPNGGEDGKIDSRVAERQYALADCGGYGKKGPEMAAAHCERQGAGVRTGARRTRW